MMRDEVKNVLTSQIEDELFSYTELLNLTSLEKVSGNFRQIAKISNCRVTLVDVHGKVLADSERDAFLMENHLNRPEIQEARLKGKGKSIRFSNSIDMDMLYTAVAVREGGEIKGYIRLSRPLYAVQNVIDKVYQYILLSILVVAVISLLIALFFSYRLYEPVKAMERFTEKLRKGEAVGTIILDTVDETKTLAENINYLVRELRDKIRIANEEKSKLMTAFTNMNEGVLIINAQGRIEFVSPVLANMLSVHYDDVYGRTLIEAFRSIDLEKALIEFKKTGQNVTREIVLGSPEQVILNTSISAVHGHPGEEKVMIVFHDVTRLKRLETIKTDFVANVTHEIKTPLTAIIGYLETIQNGAIHHVEETKQFIAASLKQAERLNRLVDDLLTLSNIETKETALHFENVFLRAAVHNIIALIQPKASQKKITVHNNVPENFVPIRADGDKLTQILINILDNAVKFTAAGGRIIIDAEESGSYALVSITDTGIGIPRDEIQHLGERFYRVDKSRSRELGGTGLGLSIVKHFMMAHGGRMEIESQWGKGTKVSLFFPIQNI
jgi:two-component system phosphate regulon sensor histidine kinase PhoR